MDIREVFDKLITGLENNDLSNFDELFLKDAYVLSSTHGELKGIEAIKEGLKWKGDKLDYKKIRVSNNVVRTNKQRGCQFCYLVVEMTKMVNDFANNFGCGIRVFVDYENNNGDFKIKELRTNMVYETGNTMLVSDKWHMIDYGKYDGYDTVIIDPIKHNPWTIIPESDQVLDLKHQLNEVFAHYTFCIDTDNYEELKTFVTDGIALTNFGHKTGADFCDWMRTRRVKWLEYDGVTVPKEACWNHIGEVQILNQESDDYVVTDVYRIEPNRIGNKFLNKYNLGSLVYTAKWHMNFKKVDGKWCIDKWGYENLSQEDNSQKDRRYFD